MPSEKEITFSIWAKSLDIAFLKAREEAENVFYQPENQSHPLRSERRTVLTLNGISQEIDQHYRSYDEDLMEYSFSLTALTVRPKS